MNFLTGNCGNSRIKNLSNEITAKRKIGTSIEKCILPVDSNIIEIPITQTESSTTTFRPLVPEQRVWDYSKNYDDSAARKALVTKIKNADWLKVEYQLNYKNDSSYPGLIPTYTAYAIRFSTGTYWSVVDEHVHLWIWITDSGDVIVDCYKCHADYITLKKLSCFDFKYSSSYKIKTLNTRALAPQKVLTSFDYEEELPFKGAPVLGNYISGSTKLTGGGISPNGRYYKNPSTGKWVESGISFTLKGAIYADYKYVGWGLYNYMSGGTPGVYTSTDGKTWTKTLSENIMGVKYAFGVFIAWGGSGIWYSSNASSWTKALSNLGTYVVKQSSYWLFACNGGRTIDGTYYSAQTIYASRDGKNWYKISNLPENPGEIYFSYGLRGQFVTSTSYSDYSYLITDRYFLSCGMYSSNIPSGNIDSILSSITWSKSKMDGRGYWSGETGFIDLDEDLEEITQAGNLLISSTGLYSANGGHTWDQILVNKTTGRLIFPRDYNDDIYENVIWVRPGYVVFGNGYWAIRDSSSTWDSELQTSVDNYRLTYDFNNWFTYGDVIGLGGLFVDSNSAIYSYLDYEKYVKYKNYPIYYFGDVT